MCHRLTQMLFPVYSHLGIPSTLQIPFGASPGTYYKNWKNRV